MVALKVAIPILTSLGCRVVPVPTAILSSATNYNGFRIWDTTTMMQEILKHFQEEKIVFEAIYSGFLGSASQVDLLCEYLKKVDTEETLVVIDPVFGDDGRLYSSMDDDMVNSMKDLLRFATHTTPNMTEACYLTGTKYSPFYDENLLCELTHKLASIGAKHIVITGIQSPNSGDFPIATYTDTTIGYVYYYDSDNDTHQSFQYEHFPSNLSGIGDTFTSVLTGYLMQGKTIQVAIQKAIKFTYLAVKKSSEVRYDDREGVLLAKVMPFLEL